MGVAVAHDDMHAHADERGCECQEHGPGHAGRKQHSGDRERPDGHGEAAAKECVHDSSSGADGIVVERHHMVTSNPKLMASTARARPALIHGLFDRFQRPS